MNILSLFDGMSCGQLALQRAGIEVEKYYASEIDKHAIKVTQHNFPKTTQLGTVEQWQLWDIENGLDWSKVDLIIAGSPCQGFSFAGNQLAFDDPRSKLFFTFVDILKHARQHNPNVKFLLENVKMKKEFEQAITDTLGIHPIEINSALVSAQTRKRLYWSNWWFPQPANKDVGVEDILEAKHHKPVRVGGLRGRRINPESKREDYNKSIPIQQHIEPRADNKSNCLTTVRKDNICTFLSKGRTPFKKGLCWDLSIFECERLQTVPDGYTKTAPETQRFRMLGNGWTVDVIAHIFDFMDDLF